MHKKIPPCANGCDGDHEISPQDRLKEIKHIQYEGHGFVPFTHVEWLILRVEQLTKALEHYSDPKQFEDRGLGVTTEEIAREALNTGPKPLSKGDE